MENKIIDAWTFIHALVGFCIGTIIPSKTLGYSIIIGYEVIENKYLIGTIFQEGEGMLNIISDLVFGLGAYELGRKYGDKKI